jgi:O-antigen/teichoic acid export membrane protein
VGRGAGKLAIGKGLSLLIGLATAPVISRLFHPGDFGIAGMVKNMGAWCLAFACLGYASAIPLSRRRSETRSLVKLCLLLTGGLTALLVPSVLLSRHELILRMRAPQLHWLIWFVPLIFLVGSLLAVTKAAGALEGRFGRLSMAHFAGANVGRVIHIVFGIVLGGSAGLLVIGTTLGNVAALAITAAVLVPLLRPARPEDNEGDPPPLRDVASEHRQFPLVNVWNHVLSSSTFTLPVLILGALFSPKIVGLFVFGRRILLMPMKVVGSSVGQAFYPQAAREWRETGHVTETVDHSLHLVTTLCLFPIVTVGLVGPLVFRTIFAGRWYEAGVYAQYQAPWLLVTTLLTPVQSVFLIARKARILLLYNVAQVILCPLAMVAGHHFGGPRLSVALFAAAGTFVHLHRLRLAMRLGYIGRHTVLYAAGEALRATALLVPAAIAFWAGDYRYVSMVLILLATIAYYGWIYHRDPAIRGEVRQFLRRMLRRPESPTD